MHLGHELGLVEMPSRSKENQPYREPEHTWARPRSKEASQASGVERKTSKERRPSKEERKRAQSKQMEDVFDRAHSNPPPHANVRATSLDSNDRGRGRLETQNSGEGFSTRPGKRQLSRGGGGFGQPPLIPEEQADPIPDWEVGTVAGPVFRIYE